MNQDTLTDWNSVDGSAGQIPDPKLDDIVFVPLKDQIHNVYMAVPGKVMGLLSGQVQVRVAVPVNDGKFALTTITYSRDNIFPSMESCLKNRLYQSMAYSCMYAADMMSRIIELQYRGAAES